MAVIELANSLHQYDAHNYVAAGVCYNNIGNLLYKNAKYTLAKENYQNAIMHCELCMGGFFCNDDEKPEKMKKKPLKKMKRILANRNYQLVMCEYKQLRYTQQRITLEEKENKWNDLYDKVWENIEMYMHLSGGGHQFMFFDMVIKLLMMSAYINLISRKIVSCRSNLIDVNRFI